MTDTDGAQAQLTDCVAGQGGQSWTHTASGQLADQTGKCLDASGQANRQWSLR